MTLLSDIQFNLKAPKNQYNAFGKYYYRNCEDILEALKPLLHEYEASVQLSDLIVNIGNRYYVQSIASLHDKTGQQVASSVAYAREAEIKKGMDESQITGSSSSYSRKYALNGLFLIDDTKDADSNNKHDEVTDKPKQDPPQPEEPKKASPKQDGPNQDKGFFAFLTVMGKQKERVGEVRYHKLLEDHGYKHANEIKNRAKQEAIFKELKDISDGYVDCPKTEGAQVLMQGCKDCDKREGCPSW